MKHSNCDIGDLWSGVAFAYQSRSRRIPLYLQVARRALLALERRI
jgi:hypothetical protein